VNLIIYGDNKIEAFWFRGLTPLLNDAKFVRIGRRGKNHPKIDELISYDRPDIILTDNGNPVLVLEKTREVPTGHNVGQRVARLVRAAELGIPVLCFFPFDAMKHGQYFGLCNLNIRLLKAFEQMTYIHGVPVIAVSWPVDQYGELVDDGSENDIISQIVHDFLSNGFDKSCQGFKHQLSYMRSEYKKRMARRASYEKPPPSVIIKDTESVISECKDLVNGLNLRQLAKRRESLVYKIVMNVKACKRQDPYTGTQFIYDYIWCRTGPDVREKSRNLILYFPKINISEWERLNPNDNGSKSCNWYLTANAFVFRDAVHVLRI